MNPDIVNTKLDVDPSKMDYSKENYIFPRPTAEEWEDHFNVLILKEHEKYIGGSVLDVGCNHGATTFWLSKFKSVTSITGVDINSDPFEIAKKIFEKVTIDYDFVKLDFTKDFIHDKIFDSVVCLHTLEHIWPKDTTTFLTNIYKNLTPSGHFLVSVPYGHVYDNGIHHVNFYDVDKLCEDVVGAGFSKILCTRSEGNTVTGIFKK